MKKTTVAWRYHKHVVFDTIMKTIIIGLSFTIILNDESIYQYSLWISLYSLEVLVKGMASVQIHISFVCNGQFTWLFP